MVRVRYEHGCSKKTVYCFRADYHSYPLHQAYPCSTIRRNESNLSSPPLKIPQDPNKGSRRSIMIIMPPDFLGEDLINRILRLVQPKADAKSLRCRLFVDFGPWTRASKSLDCADGIGSLWVRVRLVCPGWMPGVLTSRFPNVASWSTSKYANWEFLGSYIMRTSAGCPSSGLPPALTSSKPTYHRLRHVPTLYLDTPSLRPSIPCPAAHTLISW